MGNNLSHHHHHHRHNSNHPSNEEIRRYRSPPEDQVNYPFYGPEFVNRNITGKFTIGGLEIIDQIRLQQEGEEHQIGLLHWQYVKAVKLRYLTNIQETRITFHLWNGGEVNITSPHDIVEHFWMPRLKLYLSLRRVRLSSNTIMERNVKYYRVVNDDNNNPTRH